MNSAPEWQDGECCFRCRTEFTIVARKHHCRNCGNVFCAKCSSQQIPIPKFGIEKNVRVCADCYDKLALNGTASSVASTTNGRPSLTSTNSKVHDISSSDTISTTSSATIGSTSTVTTAKTPASASAPSEQELKEEEELQLALALSLSEAETPSKGLSKISFPDCKQLELEISNLSKQQSTTNNNVSRASTNPSVATAPTTMPNNSNSDSSSSPKIGASAACTFGNMIIDTPLVDKSQDAHVPSSDENDTALFKFVADLQSSAAVFVNRINSNKLRGRPIANDTAIQSLFLNLTNMHSKLLEYIKDHDDQRAYYEGLQDKITQIHDARAALDALREEHQEKIRLAAEEAERNRQNQLSHKLELMRQKKSQMLQYQRDMAMQRIQEQEMEFMMRQDKNKYSTLNWQTQAMLEVNNPIQGPLQGLTSGPMQGTGPSPMLGPTPGPMQGSTTGQIPVSTPGPMQGPTPGLMQGPTPGSMQGPTSGMVQGPTPGSMQGPTLGPIQGQTPSPIQGPIQGSMHGAHYDQSSWQSMASNISGIRPNIPAVPTISSIPSDQIISSMAANHQMGVSVQSLPHQALSSTATSTPLPSTVVDEAPLISFDD